MSDLATLVAAAIRDKVFHELKEENDNLRIQVAETAANAAKYREAFIQSAVPNAVLSFNRPIYVAIQGPSLLATSRDPVVFAVDHTYRETIQEGQVLSTGFKNINDCVLGDLQTAFIFANGIAFRIFGQAKFMLSFEIDPTPSVNGTSLDSIWDWDDDRPCFTIEGSSDLLEFIHFHLVDVSKEKWLELAQIDVNEYIQNPVPIDRYEEVSLEAMIACFGANAKVEFHTVD